MKSIDDFKALISSRGGLAKSSLFRVIVPSATADESEATMFLCESCTFPGRTINTEDVVFQNNSIKIPHSFSVDDISMTFILTNDFYIRYMLETWQSSIINKANYTIAFEDAYTRIIELQMLDMDSKVVYAVRLLNAYPTTIQGIDVSSGEDTILKVNATFTYEDYEELDLNGIPVEVRANTALNLTEINTGNVA